MFKNGKVELCAVNTGIQDNVHIEILSGVTKDETIIIGSYNVVSKSLKNGDTVQLTNNK